MKLYTQKGIIHDMTSEKRIYNCGGYLVGLIKGSPEFILTALPDPYCFYTESFCKFYFRSYKRALFRRPVFSAPLRTKNILKNLVDKKFFLEGRGITYRDTVRSILDQASFWPFVVSGRITEHLLEMMPDYYAALCDQSLLSELERKVLEIITAKEIQREGKSLRIIHGKDTYKAFYVTMDYLVSVFGRKGYTKEEIYDSLASLYEQHCIYFLDKEPSVFYEPPIPESALEIFNIGDDLGLPFLGEERRGLI